jgi:cellulose synthase operon protein C
MRRSAGTLAMGLLLSVALPAGVALASDPSEQLMLERANYWRTQQRLDVVSDILNKLLAANPDQPDALYQQGALAMQRGDSGTAQQYFDRLRQLASSDARAAELLAALGQPTTTSAAPATKPVAVTLGTPPTPLVATPTPQPPAPRLAVASADSGDLTPAKPAAPTSAVVAATPHVVPGASLAEAARAIQVASLPQTTVSDSDTPLLVAASAGSSDLGITAKAVQVAQVELEAPPPISGFQPLGTLRPYAATDTLEMDIDRDLQRLESASNPTLVAGFGYRTHSGTEGTDSLDEFGFPIEATFSPWYTGTARIDIVPVYLEAGTPANGNLGLFGANPLTYPIGLGAVSAGDQNATGVGISGSYTFSDFYGQFGTTPLGFPVTNLIGDVAYLPKFLDGTLSVRIEGQRQAVTDSLLSYAGTRTSFSKSNIVAPGALGTNTLWGGVVKTGPHVSVFYDNQSVGGYAGAGYSWLDGTNVKSNGAVDALIGAYFRPWKTDNWALRVGVSLYYTGYERNLDGFSYGQGGYFSPQDFEGLGFPIEFTGHTGPWSYLASATLGVQHFNQDSSPTFPNNPYAQAAVETLAPADAFLTGIHSTGFGYNLKGQVEYAVDPTLSLGAAGSLNNGNSYTEGIVQVYLRKTFDWFAPVAIKNDPESIAARDMPMSHL